MATNLEKLRGLLQELFQLDQADLDFGIYRIMNQKRDEVVRFLDKDLLPQVQAAFAHYQSADKSILQGELEKAIQQAKALGVDPESIAKVKELRQQLAESTVDVAALENEVFSHLFNFFRRYYSEGDFISLRRYRKDTYAIPYEGEEVKLHWANADQYYVKSSETFRDYTFKVADGRRVHFRLVAASTEQDNNKAAQDKERRFVLAEDPVSEDDGELTIRFEYRSVEGNAKQDALNKQSVESVLASSGAQEWLAEIGRAAPTEKNPHRTVLEKHLTQYTARNTFDYFIHKDLGGFLRRELDFYIKNEVLHLDDIEAESAPKVEQYLSQIKVLRRIAHKIIQFLSQIEDFQKRLWLKKKFVVETNYCISLDRVPEDLYPEIATNDAQREEWVRLFAIDEIKKDLSSPGYSKPLKVEFLKAHPSLVVDTQHFSSTFTNTLLTSINNLDEQVDGVVIGSENFSALQILQPKCRDRIRCIYIDPPYNTSASEIMYKNSYKHSSWLSLLYDRAVLARSLMTDDGVISIAIDDAEYARMQQMLETVFGESNCLATVAVRSKPQGRAMAAGFSQNHEYAVFYAKTAKAHVGLLPREGEKLARYSERDEHGIFSWANFRGTGANSFRQDRPLMYYPIWIDSKTKEITVPELAWSKADEALRPLGSPSGTQIEILPNDEDEVERVWMFGAERARRDARTELEARCLAGRWQIYRKYRPNQDGTLPGTWWADPKYSASESGTKVLSDIFGGANVFSYPKSISTVEDCIRSSGCSPGDTVLDFFAGSATTAHAIVNLNRLDGGRRKFLLVEMGAYFAGVTIPRIKKVAFAPEWKGGKPKRMASAEELARGPKIVKYMRLESYEDALVNLDLKPSEEQASLLDADAEMREQYTLSYALDVETRGSQSLLNVEAFRNPDEYKLRVERNGETQLVNVDLVETFNWLLGLTVKHIDVIRGVRVVDGTGPNGERVLVLWRNIDQMDNDALDQWFEKQGYSTRELTYDVFYVNGDNNLENLRRVDQTWKVRLIEEEFQRLMFDVQDV